MKTKKLWFILALPLLMSFQCDEEIQDDFFQSNLVVQNDSSFNLFLEISPNENINPLNSQDSTYIEGSSSSTGFINPSEFEFLEGIKIYIRDENEDLVLVYEQTPIQDEFWIINESTTKNVDHILPITDDLLNF